MIDTGGYLNFHPHLHAVASDGLFDRAGGFTPLPEAKLRALRDLFRATVFRLLVQRRLLSPALVRKFMQWNHSGFNLFRGDPGPGPHRAELEKLAQYILRHSFCLEKMTYLAQTGRVIYHSRLIDQEPVIERILRHLDLWEEPARPTDRGPPQTACARDRELFTDDLPFGPDTYAE